MNIVVVSGGIKTILPVVNELPDWSSVTEQALSILQAAYAAGDYEIIPDPEPVEEPVIPNWDGFNAYMLTDPMFKNYRDVVREVDGDLNSALFDAYGLISTNGVAAFSLVWGVWTQVSQITTEHKLTIAGVATMFNLPTDFISTISQ